MGKVILVCGKICSGKSYYSNQLKEQLNAVVITPDEATYELINNEQGEFYNAFSERLNKYLTRKVGEIAKAGANVIFERGLWSREDRKVIRDYYKEIIAMAENVGNAEIVEFCNGRIAQLDNKAINKGETAKQKENEKIKEIMLTKFQNLNDKITVTDLLQDTEINELVVITAVSHQHSVICFMRFK